MIYNLDGTYETPFYRKNTHLRLYNNTIKENYPPHWHAPLEILMPTENNYTININNTSYTLEPYDLVIVGSRVIHSTKAPEDGQRYFLQIDVSRLKDFSGVNAILSFIGPFKLFTPKQNPILHGRLMKLFTEICDEYKKSEEFDFHLDEEVSARNEELYEAANSEESEEISSGSLCEPIIYAKFLTMLTLIGRAHLESVETDSTSQSKKKEYAGKFMTVSRYIDEHFTEEISLEEVAEVIGFSKYHFSRLFKQFTNVSFYKYVNQQRIAYAEELLSDPDLSITQVALKCGFSNTSTFIRMFKQIKNCTPTDFRKLRESY